MSASAITDASLATDCGDLIRHLLHLLLLLLNLLKQEKVCVE